MKKKLNVVLAGQANVGKSVIFNHLTGLHQHIGNWPGKTVEKAEGNLHYKGHSINVLDLPGICSLATYSLEEQVSREYIALENPDFIINVVDGTNLERNLIFTLQLLEMEKPTVLALNFSNLFSEKGMKVSLKKLEEILEIPVVPVAAIYGKGIAETLDSGIKLLGKKARPKVLKYGKEVEERIKELVGLLGDVDFPYPKRWLAIKLLEKDGEIEKLIRRRKPEVLREAENLSADLEKVHGHSSAIVISGERCHLVSEIVRKAVRMRKPARVSVWERLDNLTCHRIWGYPIMISILSLVFLSIFKFGNWFSSVLENATSGWQGIWESVFGVSILVSLGWSAVESAVALVEIALPYVIPFYLFLFLLEDWGYLARVAFLSDNLMHKMGIHGKACIPLMLGFGCNVPACLSCRIMETQRERFITGFLTTFVPCSAVAVIAMGLVGKFLGIGWLIGLYIFVILVIFGLGKLAMIFLPGRATELIMEMPAYRMPSFKTVALQTWFRLREFIFVAGPIVIISGVIIKGMYLTGWLETISFLLRPVTVGWLGLPVVAGTLLILGILRKELILIMLATLFGTTNFASVLSPVQMMTLTLVSMLYIPCVATIAALKKEFGWNKALAISLFKIIFAVGIAGLFSRLLGLFL